MSSWHNWLLETLVKGGAGVVLECGRSAVFGSIRYLDIGRVLAIWTTPAVAHAVTKTMSGHWLVRELMGLPVRTCLSKWVASKGAPESPVL